MRRRSPSFRLVDPFGGKMASVAGVARGRTRHSREAPLEFEMRPGETRELTKDGE